MLGRYVLEIRLHTGAERDAVDAFVRECYAQAVVHHHDSYRSSYHIPQQVHTWVLLCPDSVAGRSVVYGNDIRVAY